MKFIYLFLILFNVQMQSQTNFEKGQKLFEEGKFDSSKPFFENDLKENPNHLKAIEYLGDIEGNSKSWDKAIYYYSKLKNLKPTEANYFYKYGGALGMKAKDSNKFAALSMIGEVKSAFEKAIILNPKHIDARWALIELYLQLPGIVGGSERKAKKYANELSKISPVDGFLAKGRIDEYYERYTDAEKKYISAIEIGKSKICYQKLADLYKNKMKQPEKAKTVLAEFEKKG